ncbi:MAG: DUF1640 domain-containing protein [Rhodospirillales bacterium RIFCSPLOWO2_12_FULL_58_28]|nr:MAG: DUF1640 domain-containing protein [Rhodospirillales bacterium RIFCSPLOWO2_02_FULL_58_16]OHC79037.1 MAG: DUF1640 domain-containing protein [Rhodospirillales bacterium RIFCSPLOWO2_12_FULL_58_28]
MTAITFDTLKFVERLKAAGIPEAHAKAEAEALIEALSESATNSLATKRDVSRIEVKLVEHDGEFKLIKWMLGILMAGVMSLIIKSFF